ncbi:MAG: universal stress protein [Spongiibacteraceae bacterium]
MPNYQRIIAAVDFSDEADQVLERASGMAKHHQAELHILHVEEPLNLAYGGDIPMDFSGIQEQLHAQATENIQRAGERFGVAVEQQHIVTGRPDAQIHALAESLEADLIIIGSHGRKGLALLLGSNANAVLHGAGCDVLAVRVGHHSS